MDETRERLDRHAEMKQLRAIEEPPWRDIAALFDPDDRDFDAHVQRRRDDSTIFDGTPCYALDNFAGGTFDQMTAAALMATAAAATWGAGVGSCPGNCGIAAQPASGSASSSSSTIYYVAGGLAIAIIGGVLWMGRSHKRTAA